VQIRLLPLALRTVGVGLVLIREEVLLLEQPPEVLAPLESLLLRSFINESTYLSK
jgi:hypothetical protein